MGVLYIILKIIYNTKFSETLISNHAKKAEKEMNLLKNDFAEMVKIKGYILRYIDFVD